MKQPCIRAAAVAIMSLLPGTVFADWPAVPLPERSQGEMVSGHMNANGLDMRASRFVTSLAKEEVLEFYRQSWDEHVENEFDDSTIIGRAEGEEYYITVKLTSAGAYTEGTIGIVKVPPENAPAFVPGEGFDRPPDTVVTSDIHHFDLPGRARTLVLENDMTPHVNRQYFLERLLARGWRIAEAPDCLTNSVACILRLEKARSGQVTMTMRQMRDFRTHITVLIES